jgi:hypothetical protein
MYVSIPRGPVGRRRQRDGAMPLMKARVPVADWGLASLRRHLRGGGRQLLGLLLPRRPPQTLSHLDEEDIQHTVRSISQAELEEETKALSTPSGGIMPGLMAR